jgi:hypothetical protein
VKSSSVASSVISIRVPSTSRRSFTTPTQASSSSSVSVGAFAVRSTVSMASSFPVRGAPPRFVSNSRFRSGSSS